MNDVLSRFVELATDAPRCFWLDGGAGRPWSGRRSILGWLAPNDPSLTYDATRRVVTRHIGGRAEEVGDDIFAVFESELASGPPDARWFGYFGYASRADLPTLLSGGHVPDAVLMRPSRLRVIEHADSRPKRQFEPYSSLSRSTADIPGGYEKAFALVQDHLRAGDSYEVNLTYRATIRSKLDPVEAYSRLRHANPAPYAGYLQHDMPGARVWLLSSSPERFAKISADRMIEARPIKGTTPRGVGEEADGRLRRLLATDNRFRAENLMIVDLLRHDIGAVSAIGTVRTPALMEVESYPAVHQLVSTVQGQLRDEISSLAALRSLFPAGSMTGAPKLRTMQIIEQIEATARGPYAGALGWVGADGTADLGVIIRSLWTSGDEEWWLGTGGGVTVHSTMEGEFAESMWKAARLLAIFGRTAELELRM